MRLFIVKVASRCNLDCDYCYIYRYSDDSWKRQPARMSLATAAHIGLRIREHTLRHGIEEVDLVYHGGEPLLAGVRHLTALHETLLEACDPVRIRFRMQTNGALFDEAWQRFCLERGITIGLSLDGPRHANDRHRLDHFGQSSFESVERCARWLASEEGRGIWSGFLTVIDLANDPIELYEYLKSFRPPSIEFLLPLGHHDLRPPGKADARSTPYADWLLRIFEAWYRERPQTIRIRRFRDVIGLSLGARTASEEWGLQPVDFAVVETNGDIEAVDTLKTTFSGANHLDLNVARNGFDDMYADPRVLDRQQRWDSLCETCRSCNVVRVCGGGYLPHRFSERSGFQNPSVYCADLEKLIRTITGRVEEDLARLASARKTEAARAL